MIKRLLFLFLLVLVLGFLTRVHKKHIQEGFENDNEENKKTYMQALGELAPAPQVQPGPQGPQGPAGPPGGSYLARGSVMNLAHPTLRLDRYFGSNVSAFLNKPNFRSQQTWVMKNDGRLINQFGGCLMRDSQTDQVQLVTGSQCGDENPDSNVLWNYDQYGRIVSRADNNVCLEVNASINTAATRGGGIIEGPKGTGKAVAEDTPILTTGTCAMGNNQVWNISG